MGFAQVSSPKMLAFWLLTPKKNIPNDDYEHNHGEHNRTDKDHKIDNLSLQRSQASFWRAGHLSNLAEDSSITS
jgi:hypothetical protein